MITWQEKLAWLGFNWEPIKGQFAVNVKVTREHGGLVSFGGGNSTEDALRQAAEGQNIDWGSIERKMTDETWLKMAHL